MFDKLILLLALFAMSCVEQSKIKHSDTKVFTWEVQPAGYDHHQVYDMGAANLDDFIEFFRVFNWEEEIDKSNKKPEG